MSGSRAKVVSSYTVIKGSLIQETYDSLAAWDHSLTKLQNISRIREQESVRIGSASWASHVAKTISRRFDPSGRDLPLTRLASAGISLDLWKPMMLWHMTRDEFLVRDFLVNWLYPHFLSGTFRMRAEDVVPYLESLSQNEDLDQELQWTPETTTRVASGLLRIAADFGLLRGTAAREFESYHLPDESLLYLIYAMLEQEHSARRTIDSQDWHMFMMGTDDVERELLRLHQFRKLRIDLAGSVVNLSMDLPSLDEYVEELCQ